MPRLFVVGPLVLVVASGFALGGCGSYASSAAEAVTAAGLPETLAGTGPCTLLAPDNDAVTAAGVTPDENDVEASIVEGVALILDELRAVGENDTMLAANKVVTIVGSDDGVYANTIRIAGGPSSAATVWSTCSRASSRPKTDADPSANTD